MPLPDLVVIPLESAGVLSVRGPDARRFLQGQLSHDLNQLTPTRPLLAGLHSAQGRCLALLRLFALGDEQVLAVLPRELLPTVTNHLRRYLLRAKAQIEPADSQWHVYGVMGPDAASAAASRQHLSLDDAGLRYLILAPRLEALPEGLRLSEALWDAEDIAAGLPQVHAATSLQFTAQMLNLDRVDGLSFEKGCYTGQEIIARAHYLGRVKRRMRRFHTPDEALRLLPGAACRLSDGRSARVVFAAPAEAGGQEFLAVTGPADPAMDAAPADESSLQVEAVELPLPYPLD